jgi:hypothetical protein
MIQKYLISILKIPILKQITTYMLEQIHMFSIEFAKRTQKTFVRPRSWSNIELRKFSHLFTGKVVNVSGWKDEDKEGNYYKNYFTNASEYYVSNYKGESGLSNIDNEIFLDLSTPVDQELKNKFDVVFNHTVLEHIFEIDTAFKNLCDMSDDVVIIILPFLQSVHYIEGSFGDYWRFSPMAIKELFKKNGFTTIYQSANDNKFYNIYTFTIATKNPEKYDNLITKKFIDNDIIGEKLFGLRK